MLVPLSNQAICESNPVLVSLALFLSLKRQLSVPDPPEISFDDGKEGISNAPRILGRQGCGAKKKRRDEEERREKRRGEERRRRQKEKEAKGEKESF